MENNSECRNFKNVDIRELNKKSVFLKLVFLIILTFFLYKWIIDKNNIFTFLGPFLVIIKPFLYAILLAYLLYLPVSKLENLIYKINNRFVRKFARSFSIFIIYLLFFTIIYFSIRLAIPFIINNIQDLIKHIPALTKKISEIQKYILDLPQDSIWNHLGVVDTVRNIKPEAIKELLLSKLDINQISIQVLKVLKLANVVFDLFVTIIVSIYMLNSRELIAKFFNNFAKAFFCPKKVRVIKKYTKSANEIFFKFLVAQIFDAILVGIITSIAMTVLKVKYAIFLGVLIGFMNLIPFFGAIIGVGISAILTLITGGLVQALVMLVVVTILQQIDANIINPMILGNALDLNKILIIVSVTIGGAYFGAIGMFLAVPVTTILAIIITDYLEYKIAQRENYLKNKKSIIETKKKLKKLERDKV